MYDKHCMFKKFIFPAIYNFLYLSNDFLSSIKQYI